MKVRGSILKEAEKSLSTQQSDDTKKLFFYLLLTCKNVSLYPEDHSINMNSIRQFHEILEDHIRQYPEQWLWFHQRWKTKLCQVKQRG